MSMDVRGVAVPFDVVATVDGARETISPTAFDLGSGYAVLRFRGHDGAIIARSADRSLRLWRNQVGLFFEASLYDVDPFVLHAISGCGFGCSIGFRATDCRETIVAGVRHCRVEKAILDDVALVANPAYRRTGCWPASMAVDRLPAQARLLALAWGRGGEAYRCSAPKVAPSARVAEVGWP
jgi:phage head maturation protease